MTAEMMWKKIAIRENELCLARVLRCGQTFRWKNIHDTWSFALSDRIVLLKQDEEHIHYSQVMQGKEHDKMVPDHIFQQTKTFIDDYFTLGIQLQPLYDHWSTRHLAFHKKEAALNSPFAKFAGIRILRQDPWETLISFICSSNNNVKRISKMCDSICQEYGEYINDYEGVSFYSFPTPSKLAESASVETKLRELSFGYRAKYIYQTACKLIGPESPELSIEKLYKLREADYEPAHEFLLQLTGVGPKVADCICLMALDKHDVVPVDTHVYQIAIRDYKYKGKRDMKTMNKVVYNSIREFFKELFGPYAGWAQSVLFTSDLVDLNNGTNVKKEVKVEIKALETKRKINTESVSEEKAIIKTEQISKFVKVEKVERSPKRIRVQ